MAKNNFLEDVNRKMDEMLKRHRAELQSIEDQKKSAMDEIAKLQKDMEEAQSNIDAERYLKASDAVRILETKIEMLDKRKKQHEHKELVTEEESDEMIRSLLAHEDEIAEQYEKDVKEPIRKLRSINDAYRADVSYCEATIKRWTSNIHPNYRSETTTYADGTNRSSTPVPVHAIPYFGSAISHRITDFLSRVFDKVEEEEEEEKEEKVDE